MKKLRSKTSRSRMTHTTIINKRNLFNFKLDIAKKRANKKIESIIKNRANRSTRKGVK